MNFGLRIAEKLSRQSYVADSVTGACVLCGSVKQCYREAP